MDQKNGLSRTGISSLVACFYDAEYRSIGSIEAVSARRLVTCSDSYGAGKVLERAVLSYAQRLARHERPQIKQITRIVNTIHS
ncbi:MAG: hypothetical protein ABI947_27625 [Chloroflexota bacterium]